MPPRRHAALPPCRHETAAAISEARYYAGLARAIFGRVTEVDGDKLGITFDRAGYKKVIDRFVVPADQA